MKPEARRARDRLREKQRAASEALRKEGLDLRKHKMAAKAEQEAARMASLNETQRKVQQRKRDIAAKKIARQRAKVQSSKQKSDAMRAKLDASKQDTKTAMDDIDRLEKEEIEWILKLKQMQTAQREAYEELERVLAD